MDEVEQFVASLDLQCPSSEVLTVLKDLGVKCVKDLQYVEKDDLCTKDAVLTEEEQDLLVKKIHDKLAELYDIGEPTRDDFFTMGPDVSDYETNDPALEEGPLQTRSLSECVSDGSIQESTGDIIFYILCKEMFLTCASKQRISLHDNIQTVGKLKEAIKHQEHIDNRRFDLCFYSTEGYPFLIFNDNMPLSEVVFKKEDYIFAFPYLKTQPKPFKYFQSLRSHRKPESHGTPTRGKFPRNFGTASDNVLVLRKKVTELEKCSWKGYKSVVQQTNKGTAKFFAILRNLAQGKAVNRETFVAKLLEVSQFPPLAYAFHLLIKEKAVVHLQHMVALYEGFYQLCDALIVRHGTNERLDSVMEYCEYVFGFLISAAKNAPDKELARMSSVSLKCPLSRRRDLQAGNSSKSEVAGFAQKEDSEGCEDPRLLLFTEKDSLDTWTKPPLTATIPVIELGFTTTQLQQYIDALNIKQQHHSLNEFDLVYIKGFCCVYEGRSNVGNDLFFQPHLGECKPYPRTDWKKKTLSKCKASVSKDIQHLNQSDISPGLLQSGGSSWRGTNNEEYKQVPVEAIMMLLDCGRSMKECLSGMTKFDAAKQCLLHFSNRTETRQLSHLIGIATITDKITLLSKFSGVADKLEEMVSKLKISDVPSTLGNIQSVIDEFRCLPTNFPQCKRRIICFFVELKTASEQRLHKLVKCVQTNDIVVDAVVFGEPKEHQVKAICHATGGFCFKVSSLIEAKRLLEMDIMLSLTERFKGQTPNTQLTNKEMLRRYREPKEYPYNPTDPFTFQLGQRFHTDRTARNWINLAKSKRLLSPIAPSLSTQGRILKELNDIKRNPHPQYEIVTDGSNVTIWFLLMSGPEHTPYHGGVFLLTVHFTAEYPSKPPDVRFVTPVYHCNVSSSGQICHPILGRKYYPALTFRTILDNLYGLMMDPEPTDPMDSILASIFIGTYEKYCHNARQATERYAKATSFENFYKELAIAMDEELF